MILSERRTELILINGRIEIDFSSDILNIYTEQWEIGNKLGCSIILENNTSDEFTFVFTYAQLEELSKLINSDLNKNEEEVHYPHKEKDKVKIINGKFKGLDGSIYDIDDFDKKRPLSIHTMSPEFDGYVYCNYEDVEIIK